jgi:GntR family transcriptional regulator
MRKALEVLENERLIYRRQGRGTFVVETSTDSEVERFSAIVARGRKLRAETVKWSIEESVAGPFERRWLALDVGAGIYRLETTWRAGEGTSVFERVAVSKVQFPDLPRQIFDAGQLLFPIYRHHYNVVVAEVVERVRCRSCDAELAERADAEVGAPILQVQRVAHNLKGGAVELAQRSVLLGAAAVYSVGMR